MRSTFKSGRLQRKFEDNGYVLIDGFLDAVNISELRDFYFNTTHVPMQGFHATMHSTDFDYRRNVHKKISEIVSFKAKEYLSEYRPVIGNFTVKEPGNESFFDFHLDWSMLDESIARSVTIWIALEDTNAKNGNLWILEGSTHIGKTWRCSPGLHLFAENSKVFKTGSCQKKVLKMQAGDALIYDHKLFHGSPPNLTDQSRLALNLAFLPNEMTSLHYNFEEDTITAYEVDDDFYCRCLTHQAMNMKVLKKRASFKITGSNIDQETVNKIIVNPEMV